MATKKAKKKISGLFSSKEELKAEAGARIGRSITRGVVTTGSLLLHNAKFLVEKPKLQKVVPYIAFGIGVLGEVFISEKSTGGKIAKGAFEGLSTYGMVHTAGSLLGKEKLGLQGLGRTDNAAPASNASDTDWDAVADLAERGQYAADQESPANDGYPAPSMSGYNNVFEAAMSSI